jgi:hypothetical protein
VQREESVVKRVAIPSFEKRTLHGLVMNLKNDLDAVFPVDPAPEIVILSRFGK